MSELLDMVKTHYAGVNANDLDLAATVFADTVVTVSPAGTMEGIAAFRGMGETFMHAAPDARMEIVNHLESGDTIVVEGVYTGTHTGDLATPDGAIPATNRPFSFPYTDWFTARDGKFVAHRIYWDNLSFLAQLGAIPQPA